MSSARVDLELINDLEQCLGDHLVRNIVRDCDDPEVEIDYAETIISLKAKYEQNIQEAVPVERLQMKKTYAKKLNKLLQEQHKARKPRPDKPQEKWKVLLQRVELVGVPIEQFQQVWVAAEHTETYSHLLGELSRAAGKAAAQEQARQRTSCNTSQRYSPGTRANPILVDDSARQPYVEDCIEEGSQAVRDWPGF